jgi:hypothetical protein
MEEVLDLYAQPYDPQRPLVCMDERPLQLLKETRMPLPTRPGSPAKFDYEYERNGTAVHFLFTEPLRGWRKATVRERKTSKDWAKEIRALLEEDYPEAEKVVLICDQLNTHKLASLYETFPPEQARALAARLEIHYTPKHGSWLNVAECELSALVTECLDRRLLTGGWGIWHPCAARPQPGSGGATIDRRVSTGASQPRRHESS